MLLSGYRYALNDLNGARTSEVSVRVKSPVFVGLWTVGSAISHWLGKISSLGPPHELYGVVVHRAQVQSVWLKPQRVRPEELRRVVDRVVETYVRTRNNRLSCYA